ncbi:MAG: methyltransferase domain-containing protein [Oscillatoriales cyanobacterium]|nr:MAG: methyltransferase domain-containing protein [Oscillatoriales cyanobacterium]
MSIDHLLQSETDSDRAIRIQRQFDQTPYPRVPIEADLETKPSLLYSHSLATAFYARDRTIKSTEDTTILDIGCGSGFKAFLLAQVNPGSHVTGIDLSPNSVEIAIERFRHHNISDRGRFEVLDLFEIASLGSQFDYINCDEVLYLLPNPEAALKAIKSALKPDGILRINLHSSHQRARIFAAQYFFREMGFASGELEESESITLVEQVLLASSPTLVRPRQLWDQYDTSVPGLKEELIVANFLLHGDRGFTVDDVFSLVASAGLQVVAPVEPQNWDLDRLFDRAQLPALVQKRLQQGNLQDRMRWHELMSNSNRLTDLFCSPAEITVNSWQPDAAELRQCENSLRVALHPLLNTEEFRLAAVDACRYLKPLNLGVFLQRPFGIGAASASLLPVLMPLLDSPQRLTNLIDHCLQVSPVDPIDHSPIARSDAAQQVCEFLDKLHTFGYILIEQIN